MTLARVPGEPTMRCPACAFHRPMRVEEEAWEASIPPIVPLPGEQEERRPAPAQKQALLAFVPPPMPTFRPGAAVPTPAKPRGYQPPKEKL